MISMSLRKNNFQGNLNYEKPPEMCNPYIAGPPNKSNLPNLNNPLKKTLTLLREASEQSDASLTLFLILQSLFPLKNKDYLFLYGFSILSNSAMAVSSPVKGSGHPASTPQPHQ